jgi:uncharacterized phage protein (TIGR01671 family)|nr:MAG TPA: YopX protein [Caudoviricetes sp.]
MNRYLYKAKRTDNGEWVQGSLVYDNKDKMYRIITEIDYSTGTCLTTNNAPRVNASTICQCTGLKDKNSKLIWENDIVRDAQGNFYAVFYYNNYYRFSWICVKSDVFLVGTMWNLWSFHSFEVEVIGNIFDNPELLGINTPNDLDRHWLEKYTEKNDREKRD